MTDTDLLARADAFVAEDHDDFDDRYILVAELAAVLRARDSELAAARTKWAEVAADFERAGDAYYTGSEVAMVLAERAWLASVPPPASGEGEG